MAEALNRAIRAVMESYSLSTSLSRREALFGGRCEACCLHTKSTNKFVIKYVDMQSLNPTCARTNIIP